MTFEDTLRQLLREELAALVLTQASAPTEPDEILNTRKAAKLLGLDEQTVRIEAEAGRLPGLLIGRGWKFSRNALLNAIRHPNPTQSAQTGDEQLRLRAG